MSIIGIVIHKLHFRIFSTTIFPFALTRTGYTSRIIYIIIYASILRKQKRNIMTLPLPQAVIELVEKNGLYEEYQIPLFQSKQLYFSLESPLPEVYICYQDVLFLYWITTNYLSIIISKTNRNFYSFTINYILS